MESDRNNLLNDIAISKDQKEKSREKFKILDQHNLDLSLDIDTPKGFGW